MFYTTPNMSLINISCIEFVSTIQTIDPTPENNLEMTMYGFFIRLISGYVVSFEDFDYEKLNEQRNELATSLKS